MSYGANTDPRVGKYYGVFGDSLPEEFTLFLHPLLQEFSKFYAFSTHIYITDL